MSALKVIFIFFAHVAVFFFGEELLFLQLAYIARVGNDISAK